MLLRFWCMATRRSISSSDWAGQSAEVGDSLVPIGLAAGFGDDFESLRLPIIGDFPASGELTPSVKFAEE